MAIDLIGISTLIGVVTTAVVSVVNLLRQGQDRKLARSTHELVDGQSALLRKTIKSGSFAEGKAVGVTEERDRP